MPNQKHQKKVFRLCFYGFLNFIVWTISAFIGYSFTGTGDRPTLLGSIIALIIILPTTFYLGKRFANDKPVNPVVYGVTLALEIFILNLLITIPNETTKIFLGNWVIYLTIGGVFLGSYFGAKKDR